MKFILLVTLLVACIAAQLYNTADTKTVITGEIVEKLRRLQCTNVSISTCYKLIANAYGDAQSVNNLRLRLCNATMKEAPMVTKAKCCFTCYVKPPKTDDVPRGDYFCDEKEKANVPQCGPNDTPTKTSNGCPSCFVPPVVCTDLQRRACELRKADSKFPVCASGVNPTFDRTTCCVDCKPAPPKCSEKELYRCKYETYKTLKDCPATTIAKWDESVCCYNCRTVPANDEKPTDENTPCSRADFEKCASKRPECEGEQLSIARPTSCCKDCTEPETVCTKKDAIECYANQPECGDDEKPRILAGKCCRHCRPKPRKPNKCVVGCGNDEICSRDNIDEALKCRKKRLIALRMKLRCKADITKEKLRELFRNLIRRYCAKPQNEKRCEAFKERMEYCDVKVDYKCGRTTLGFGPIVTINWECPERNATRGTRQSDELENAITDAIGDENTGTDEYDGVIEAATTMPPTPTQGATGNPTTQPPTTQAPGNTVAPTAGAAKVSSVLFAFVALIVVFLF